MPISSHMRHTCIHRHMQMPTHIQIIYINPRELPQIYSITLFVYFSFRPNNEHMSCDSTRLLFQSLPLSLVNEEENASFVMRPLVLLWQICSQTWRNLVIHQLFFTFLLCTAFFFFQASSTEAVWILPCHSLFTPKKIPLREINKKWHITFNIIYIILLLRTRGTNPFKTKGHFVVYARCGL